jgi:Penicillin binding protein transpeptidase domain/Penicillin-binding Protein dimerisation domain/NTF2-like N-terminal transpeptidase domain
MASYRRRGAHAARPATAPFVAVKHAPENGANGSAPVTNGIPGGGRKSVRGISLSVFRAPPSLAKVIAAVIAVGLIVAVFAGGLWSTPSAEPTVEAFLLAWQDNQYQAAAQLTTGNPAVVARTLQDAYLQLDAAAFYLSMGRISQHGNQARAWFQASVDLGQDGAPWNYNGRFDLRQTPAGWRVVWSPQVINPGLRPGLRLAVVSTTPQRALLEDASGAPLQQPSTVYVAGVRPDRLAHPAVTAAALARITKLDASQLLGWILAAPRSSFQELVLLRPGQYHWMAHRLARVPGLVIKPTRARLFASIAPAVVGSVGTEASAELRDQGIAYRPGATVGLTGLQKARNHDLAGTPTIQVVTETATGRKVAVLQSWPGQPSRPVRTTIAAGLQTAADGALAALPASAAVIAIQASTGHILTVAEHTQPGLGGVDPLAGRYPPGPAFTIVSTEALLAAGMQVDRQVPCHHVNDVGGELFTNVPREQNFGSQPPFSADFAHACGTAFSGLSLGLTSRDLTDAAARFGLGARWQLPLPSFSGSMQPPGSVAAVAAGTIGEGSVLVSPLAMALVAAQVDSGSRHVPSMIMTPGDPPTVSKAAGAISAANLVTLRGLMRGTVHQGVARQADLAGQPVYGQVGTVLYHPGKHPVWATWFVGYRGDVAIAVLELSRSASTSAAPLAAQVLGAAG